MKATIKPYSSGVHQGHLIVLSDNDGNIVEKIAVTEVVLENDRWPALILENGNTVRVVSA